MKELPQCAAPGEAVPQCSLQLLGSGHHVKGHHFPRAVPGSGEECVKRRPRAETELSILGRKTTAVDAHSPVLGREVG